MKLLIVTQVVDKTDPFLGFFHGWLEELAKHFDHIEVICLREGEHSLPTNVRVHSLGKPSFAKASEGEGSRALLRLQYISRFLGYVWQLRAEYDAVFVHMNQEYILLAGWLWKILRKRVYLWRNHYAGGLFTDIASLFATKVFCTSRYSYTAKYKKAVIMPIGVDTNIFSFQMGALRTPRSILFLSRFAPSKRPHVLVEALRRLLSEGVQFEASFYGSALPKDAEYRDEVVRSGRTLEDRVKFFEGVPHAEAPVIFSQHEIFVNLSASGTYDKTMFEAAACGSLVLASSRDFAALAGERFLISDAEDAPAVAEKLREILVLPGSERTVLAAQLREKVLAGQSLPFLAQRIITEMSEKK